jgi:hypothetical protein
MSQQQTQTGYGNPPPTQGDDAVTTLVTALFKVAVWAVLVVLFLPLVAPMIAFAFSGGIVTTKARYWITFRWWPWVIAAGIVVVVALYAIEVAVFGQLIGNGFFDRPREAWAPELVPTFLPWAIVNLVAGLALVPAAISVQRRQVARRVQSRRMPDVMTQERVEAARKHAADWSTSRAMGVKVNVRTGQIKGRRPNGLTAPHRVGQGLAFGLVNRQTIRTLEDRFYDVRRVRDWIDPSGRYVVFPTTASSVRALLIGESGTGKTVLLTDAILCARDQGWPVVLVDAKGDPADAESIASTVRTLGGTAAIGGLGEDRVQWQMFNGSAEQITEKLMRLMPAPDGANQHYLDETRGVLAMVQAKTPLRSAEDLRSRLHDPAPHVRDHFDLNVVEAVVDSKSGQTAAQRVYQSLSTALRPLEPWISDTGWSYDNRLADVTIVPLSPVDKTQATLGDLLMVDLRHYMSTRLGRGDKSPVLVIVDEFPQLVTAESDPGDTASSLYETARSAGMGLILAAQSSAGLSNDQVRRDRALSSGAALIIARSKDPENVVKYAGTVMRMEASGAAQGEQLNTARAQHSYVIPPQDVREAWDGSFWIVQGGAIAPFRTMPPRSVAAGTPVPAQPAPTPPSAVSGPQTAAEPAPAGLPAPAAISETATPAASVLPPMPATRNTRTTTVTFAEPEEAGVVALDIELTEHSPGSWTATAWPATADYVLDDVENPERVTFTTTAIAPAVPVGEWWDSWRPDSTTSWGHMNHELPEEWTNALDQLVAAARSRYGL